MPLLSIVLSVHNDESYIGEAIGSILSQTFSDFELLVFDDGSTDSTGDILETYRDKRIRLYRSKENLGIAAQVNRGMDEAVGKYIARMDGDDIALPQRFEKQVALLEARPDIGICGTFALRFHSDGQSEVWRFPTTHENIQASLLFRGAFCNPSTVMRRGILNSHGLRYHHHYPPCEDYHLWYRILKVCKGINIPDVLLKYRLSASQLTIAKADVKHARLRDIRRIMLNDLKFPDDEGVLSFHESVLQDSWPDDYAFFQNAIAWMESIYVHNEQQQVFHSQALAYELSTHLRYRLQTGGNAASRASGLYSRAAFTKSFPLTAYAKVKLYAKRFVK